MNVLIVTLALIVAISLAAMLLILYEYWRVLHKREAVWATITKGPHPRGANLFVLSLYVLMTCILIGIVVLILLQPA